VAAAAFTATLIAAAGSPNGERKSFPLTLSDVNAEYAIFPSGGSEIVLNGKYDVWLTDIIIITGGTDTNFLEIFINGVSTGTKLNNDSSLNTTQIRPLMQAPVKVPAGSMVKFKQLTA